MGRKYIIEIGRLERLYKAFIGAHGKPEITWLSPEVDLTPYTEPDLDAIRKEECEKGVQDTKQHWVDAPRSCAYKLGYENGLNDAWEAARKICYMKWTKRNEVFGIDVYADIIALPVSECIEKIRQYEQEKDRQARIEFNCEEIKDVLNTTMKECNVSLDEIAEVLAKMKETNNG